MYVGVHLYNYKLNPVASLLQEEQRSVERQVHCQSRKEEAGVLNGPILTSI